MLIQSLGGIEVVASASDAMNKIWVGSRIVFDLEALDIAS